MAARYIITAPVSDFSGMSWGLVFTDGQAETENQRLAYRLKSMGYDVKKDAQRKTVKRA